jgi:uncharacterized protein
MKRVALLAVLLVSLPLMAQQRTIKVLVVTGGHNYTTGFYTLFQGYPDVKWDHAQHCGAGEGYGKGMAGKYDVVVLYDMPKEVPEVHQKNLMEFFEAGRGVVVLHHALATMPGWVEFHQAIGGKYLTQPEGSRPASTYQHDVRMRVRVADRSHPITRGISDFEIYDEIYGGIWVADNAQVLLTTDHPSSSRALAWVMPHPRSRVVTIQPGHGEEAFANPSYRKLVIQAIRWSAGAAERR